MGRFLPLFVYFNPFLKKISIIQIEKSLDDGVLGIRTQGYTMVGAMAAKHIIINYLIFRIKSCCITMWASNYDLTHRKDVRFNFEDPLRRCCSASDSFLKKH